MRSCFFSTPLPCQVSALHVSGGALLHGVGRLCRGQPGTAWSEAWSPWLPRPWPPCPTSRAAPAACACLFPPRSKATWRQLREDGQASLKALTKAIQAGGPCGLYYTRARVLSNLRKRELAAADYNRFLQLAPPDHRRRAHVPVQAGRAGRVLGLRPAPRGAACDVQAAPRALRPLAPCSIPDAHYALALDMFMFDGPVSARCC